MSDIWQRFRLWITRFRPFRRWAPPPPVAPPSAAVLLTVDMVAREAVRRFHDSGPFLRQIHRQYDEAKTGSQLRIRYPVDYRVEATLAPSNNPPKDAA